MYLPKWILMVQDQHKEFKCPRKWFCLEKQEIHEHTNEKCLSFASYNCFQSNVNLLKNIYWIAMLCFRVMRKLRGKLSPRSCLVCSQTKAQHLQNKTNLSGTASLAGKLSTPPTINFTVLSKLLPLAIQFSL